MKRLYAIRDRVAKELVGHSMYILFAFRTDQQAVRYFADALLDDKSILNKHPNDYELVALGELKEDATLAVGYDLVLDGYQPFEVIITGSALIASQTEHQPLRMES